MNLQEIINILRQIDNFLYWGDRDSAHELILKLIAKLTEVKDGTANRKS